MQLMPISQMIWETKYKYAANPEETSPEHMWRRLAKSIAQAEQNSQMWETKFFDLLKDFRFLPGGRIQAGAGTKNKVTLLNCFVMGELQDSMDGIFNALKESAITMQQGGGIGYDFSTLRPRGIQAQTSGATASGPVSFMRIWNAMCATILSTGSRRGAMMATLRCDHPDIMEFVTAKGNKGDLNHFNLSVLVTDAFMKAVRADQPWDLTFPAGSKNVQKTIRARELWDTILEQTYSHAEPGVLFIDRINTLNNLWYCEKISATNPCGEIPLPPYGACNLGSFNLTTFVQDPFQPKAQFNWYAFEDSVEVAVRFLDNVITASQYPLEQQKIKENACRRIGLGITGLADTFHMLGMSYSSDQARAFASLIGKSLCEKSYLASTELARERDAFDEFDKDKYLRSSFVQTLPPEIRKQIEKHGMRNSHLVSIAPTGTISLLANNVSSGIEPVFDYKHMRQILGADGKYQEFEIWNYGAKMWSERFPGQPFPKHFSTALEISPLDHLRMQAALQPYVDHAISKTINIPEKFPFAEFKSVYDAAYDAGLKGITTFRPNEVTGSILKPQSPTSEISHQDCCAI